MDVLTLGIDVGSTASKCIILKNGKDVISKSLVSVGAGTSGPQRAIDEVLDNLSLTEKDMQYILATGYGRNSLPISHNQMSELSCHARGAYFLFPKVKTVIDIGGQDTKTLKIGVAGILENFVMNDKCAAGTGRFLDVMANVLEVDINQFGDYDSRYENKISISSTCTVFAESEVISQLAQNAKREDIIRGIHNAIAARVSSLAKRVGVQDEVVMTGGVALNKGIIRALEDSLGKKVHTSPMCQYNGALGAALFAYTKYIKEQDD